jgi:hypothetical protein
MTDAQGRNPRHPTSGKLVTDKSTPASEWLGEPWPAFKERILIQMAADTEFTDQMEDET